MSEKSRSRSGIGLALLAAGRARADDANRLFAIVIPPHGVNDQHDPSRDRAPNPLEPAFPLGVGRIVPLQTIRIGENCRRFLEWDPMFMEIE
jgi:hypothetical protein